MSANVYNAQPGWGRQDAAAFQANRGVVGAGRAAGAAAITAPTGNPNKPTVAVTNDSRVAISWVTLVGVLVLIRVLEYLATEG